MLIMAKKKQVVKGKVINSRSQCNVEKETLFLALILRTNEVYIKPEWIIAITMTIKSILGKCYGFKTKLIIGYFYQYIAATTREFHQ